MENLDNTELQCRDCQHQLGKLRSELNNLKEQNSRLMSQLHHSLIGWKRFAKDDASARLPSETLPIAGCLSQTFLADQDSLTPLADDLAMLKALQNHDDPHVVVPVTKLKEEIARTRQEWQSLAEWYNKLVEQVQESENKLCSVKKRNYELQILNAELLSVMQCTQSSSQEMQGNLQELRSPIKEMHQESLASPTQAIFKGTLAPVPAESMAMKSLASGLETCNGSVYSSPICTSDQSTDSGCVENSDGSVYSSPICTSDQSADSGCVEQSFDSGYGEDIVGSVYSSPIHTLKDSICIENEKDGAGFDFGGGGEPSELNLFYAPMAMPSDQEIDTSDEAAYIKYSDAARSDRDESAPTKPCRNQSLNSTELPPEALTSMFATALHLPEKEESNLSPRNKSSSSSTPDSSGKPPLHRSPTGGLPKSISIRVKGFSPNLKPGSPQSPVLSPLHSHRFRLAAGPAREGEVHEGNVEVGGQEWEVYAQGTYKTELCNKWATKCPYGERCRFAHGFEELRPVARHNKYKTNVCHMFAAGEPCTYGHRCHFRHVLKQEESKPLAQLSCN